MGLQWVRHDLATKPPPLCRSYSALGFPCPAFHAIAKPWTYGFPFTTSWSIHTVLPLTKELNLVSSCPSDSHILPWSSLAVSDFFAPETSFMEDNFSTDPRSREWLGMIQALHLLCTLFLIYCGCWSDRRYKSVAWRLGAPVAVDLSE